MAFTIPASTAVRRGAACLGALLMTTSLAVAAAPASHAASCNPGTNKTVSKFGGDYKAIFKHHGETLTVEDHNSGDTYAAVAYVEVHRFERCIGELPKFSAEPVDTDRFVMSIGRDTYNLGTPDGTGDIPEGWLVKVMVCRGYKSLPGDNCSDWGYGVS